MGMFEHAVVRPDMFDMGRIGVREHNDAIALGKGEEERLHPGLRAEMAAPEVKEMGKALPEALLGHETGVQGVDAELAGPDLLIAKNVFHDGAGAARVGATGGEPIIEDVVVVADEDAAEIEDDGWR
ncbi:hypothetical protein MPC1_2410005 [Methylocella tundrae]|nr:hypothetical protein MPC1_2410005 [Methylocella tundrae]